MTLLLAESFLHTLDPFAIEFPASWHSNPMLPDGLRWYGLAYLAGFVVAWWLIHRMVKSGRSAVPVSAVGDFITAMILGVLIGGRLGYIAFYEQPLLWEFSRSFPFWGVLMINKGGMASHGGMIGVAIACWVFARRRRVPFLHLLDLTAFVTAPGFLFGRIANFINAELWGRPIPPSMQAAPPWWSVKYPTQILERWLPVVERGAQPDEHYAKLISRAAADFSIHAPSAELTGQVVNEAQHRLGVVLDQLSAVLPASETILDDVVRIAGDANAKAHGQVAEVLRPLLTAYYPSQLIQALAEGVILLGILVLIWVQPRKPGVIAAWFLIAYGMLRVATEQFREPDTGVAVWLGLSRGQWLSAAMIVLGIVVLRICVKRDVKPLGGFRAPPA